MTEHTFLTSLTLDFERGSDDHIRIVGDKQRRPIESALSLEELAFMPPLGGEATVLVSVTADIEHPLPLGKFPLEDCEARVTKVELFEAKGRDHIDILDTLGPQTRNSLDTEALSDWIASVQSANEDRAFEEKRDREMGL